MVVSHAKSGQVLKKFCHFEILEIQNTENLPKSATPARFITQNYGN